MYSMSKHLIITRRVTSNFLKSLPETIEQYSAYLYLVVDRAPHAILKEVKYGDDVRIDPCYFDWATKSITMYIPYDINPGIGSIDDIEPTFYEGVEAAFLALLFSVSP